MADTVDLVQATWNAANNAVQGQLRQQGYGRRVRLMSIIGPANSTLTIYRGGIPNFAGAVTTVYPASARTFDAANAQSPIDIRPGEVATFQWTGGNSGVGQTASCNIVSEVYA